MNRIELAEQIAAEERARTEKVMGRELFKASWERMVLMAHIEAQSRYLELENDNVLRAIRQAAT